MYSFLLKIAILTILLFDSVCGEAQKNIVISDVLAANADQVPVKLGTQGLGKIKTEFGEYHVVSGKAGWTTTTTKGNLFNTRSESNSKEKFSFIMSNSVNDTASVNAENYIKTQSTQGIRLSSRFSLGSNELQQWSQNFTAFITLNHDTTDTWALLMNGAAGNDTVLEHEAYLSNGDRRILLLPVNSNKNNDDKRMLLAYGYEFSEGGKPLCAVQYFGGGLLGRNKIFVWIDKRLDQKTKLLLSAAVTAVLQLKTSEF